MNQYSIILLNRKGAGTLKVSPYCLYNPVLCSLGLSGVVSVMTARQKIQFGGIKDFDRPRHVRYRGSTSNTVFNTGFYVKCQYARYICLRNYQRTTTKEY